MSTSRFRLAHVLAWLLFVRFQLLVALLFFLFPFLATGPFAPLLQNLFLLSLGGLFGVTLLALVVGKTLVLATDTASRSGPIRLLPARVGGTEMAGRPFEEQQAIGFALAWDPEGRIAHILDRFHEPIAVALAVPTVATAFVGSHEPSHGYDGAWTLWKVLAVGAGVLAYLMLRAVAKLVESWFANPEATSPVRTTGPLAKLDARARAKPQPRFARLFRRRAIRFLLLPSFRTGYVRERSSDEAQAEVSRRLDAGESEEAIVKSDDLTLRFDLLPGHGAAYSFFGLVFSVYLVLGAVNYPGWVEPWFPTLGYVLILIMGIGWGLAALSFWFDRFRIPVLLVLFGTSILTAWIGGGDHFFRLIEPPATTASAGVPVSPASLPNPPVEVPASPDELVLVELVRNRCEQPLVAVAAAGGGITSAAWTAAVLTRFAELESGGAFLDSLRIVSGVSGGSVGAMFFLDGVSIPASVPAPSDPSAPSGIPRARLSPEAGARIRHDASAPSLDAVGWGLAYPDFARSLLSPVINATMPFVDRSWALERSWEQRLVAAAHDRAPGGPATGSAPTLRAWREATLRGELPALILNATTVESGERFQMTTLRLTSGGGRSDFWEAFPGYDIALSTAARLSATFPFVSTSARARGCCGEVKPGAHFVDGGYYDNSGLLSALELLDRTLGVLAETESCRPPVVILRLEPFNVQAASLAQIEPASGWQSSIVSPATAIIQVRTSTQVYRNKWESGIFAQKWRERGFQVEELTMPLGGFGPLSWKLTANEIARIDRISEDILFTDDALKLIRLLEGRLDLVPATEPAEADAAARSDKGPAQKY